MSLETAELLLHVTDVEDKGRLDSELSRFVAVGMVPVPTMEFAVETEACCE